MNITIIKKQKDVVMLHKYGPRDDKRLSFGAVGVLAYLLSHDPGWTCRIEDLKKRKTNGRDACRKFLNELKDAGYHHIYPVRDEKGRVVEWDSITTDIPRNHPEWRGLLLEQDENHPLRKMYEQDIQNTGNQESGIVDTAQNAENPTSGQKDVIEGESSRIPETQNLDFTTLRNIRKRSTYSSSLEEKKEKKNPENRIHELRKQANALKGIS